jgi:hypothetical protein
MQENTIFLFNKNVEADVKFAKKNTKSNFDLLQSHLL